MGDLIDRQAERVPGCLLKKRRGRAGSSDKVSDVCNDSCTGCGWGEMESAERIARIRNGEMKQCGDLLTLIIKH